MWKERIQPEEWEDDRGDDHDDEDDGDDEGGGGGGRRPRIPEDQRYVTPEMEFLNGSFLFEVSAGHKLGSSHTRVFVCFCSALVFLFYKLLFTNRLEF